MLGWLWQMLVSKTVPLFALLSQAGGLTLSFQATHPLKLRYSLYPALVAEACWKVFKTLGFLVPLQAAALRHSIDNVCACWIAAIRQDFACCFSCIVRYVQAVTHPIPICVLLAAKFSQALEQTQASWDLWLTAL